MLVKNNCYHNITNFLSLRLLKANDFPSSSTLKADAFVINDMVIGTSKSNVIFFQSEGSKVEVNENQAFIFQINWFTIL